MSVSWNERFVRYGLKRFLLAERAASAIEFALITPVLLFFLIGALDLGLAVSRAMDVAWSVQVGAQYASLYGYGQAPIKSAVQSASSVPNLTFPSEPSQFCGCTDAATTLRVVSCTTTCNNGKAAGTYVSVTAQSSYETLLSYPGLPARFLFSSSATVRTK